MGGADAVGRRGPRATWDRLAESLEEQSLGKAKFVINRTLEAPREGETLPRAQEKLLVANMGEKVVPVYRLANSVTQPPDPDALPAQEYSKRPCSTRRKSILPDGSLLIKASGV